MHIAIIGAGISGLYSAYLLEQRYPRANITIYEKSSRIGGRIQTERPLDGVQFEGGAGRIAEHHHRVWRLLKRYNATYKKNNASKQYLDTKSYPITKHSKHIREMYNKTPIQELRELSFRSWAERYTSINVEQFINAFGYSGKFELMCAYDACRAVVEELECSFYAITSGLDILIKGLRDDIRANIFTNTHIDDVKQDRRVQFSDGRCIQPDMVVIAVPVQRIPHWEVLNQSNIHSIGAKSLQRVYAYCPGLKLNKRYTTQSPLRYIIPINNEKHIHMISYTDNNYADGWQKMEDKEETLQSEVRRHFDTNVEQSWWDYWDIGTSYWVPGRQTKFKKPKYKGVYIVGESVSDYQSWIEGALKSVENTLN